MAASSFIFSIPGDPPPNRSPDAAAAGRKIDCLKIMLVDDNIDLLDISAALFEDRGFEVLTASSGSDALEILLRTPNIDALLTDVVMPGMSGIELGYEARRLLPHVKIVLTSGYPNPAARFGQAKLHDFEFLKKPYRVDEAIRLLAKPN